MTIKSRYSVSPQMMRSSTDLISKEVTRTELFSKMNDLTDDEDAIIFHIDILTEG
jgi:hypothetical protein